MRNTTLGGSLVALTVLAAVHCGPQDQNTSSEGSVSTSSSAASSSAVSSSAASSGDTSSSSGGGECKTDDKAIQLGKLVHPEDGTVVDNAIIVIHEDRISYVGTDKSQIPCGATIIDWTAYTGLPGLIDAHVHFSYQTDNEPGTDPWTRSSWLHGNAPYKALELARAAVVATIKTGVTTAIDKGGYDYILNTLRAEIMSGTTQGPRMFRSLGGISNSKYPASYSPTQLTGFVQYQKLRGADLVKVWADQCSDDTLDCVPTFTFEDLKLLVDTAHAEGLPVAIHAYHGDTAKLAIMAGPDSIEHPEGLDATDFANLIEKNTFYAPTIDHNRYYKDNIEFFKYDPGLAPKFDAYIKENLETAKQAREAGVKFIMGSDAVFTGFGENTMELGWLVQAGMTPLEALRAATIHGAESIGVQNEVGKVAVGYYADIIAVEGDPLADVNVVIKGVRGVMMGGRLAKLD